MSHPDAVCPVCHKLTSTWSLVTGFRSSDVICSQCNAHLCATGPPVMTLITRALVFSAFGFACALLVPLVLQHKNEAKIIVKLVLPLLTGTLYAGIVWGYLRLFRRSVSLSIGYSEPVNRIASTDFETTPSSGAASVDAATGPSPTSRPTS